ncbi:MAG: ribosomal-processing cysteine protease Prp [Clostridiales bacterium]|nr:ribosomal-processing cysteine protease Prp [Clostridiales bacterium]
MITVKLFGKNGKIVGVKTSGHSGLAESGNDILCAAVSTLVQTAYLAISDIYGDVAYKKSDDGLFEFNVPDGHDADVIIRAMYLGLQDLSSGYPQNLKLEET